MTILQMKEWVVKNKAVVTIFASVIVVGGIFTLANNSSHDSTSTSTQTVSDTSPEEERLRSEMIEKEKRLAEKVAKIEHYVTSSTRTDEDKDGYRFEKTIRMAGWIKGDDKDALDATWKYFGGESAYTKTVTERDMVLMGTFHIQNVTDGFTISESTPYSGVEHYGHLHIDTDYEDPDDDRWVKTSTFPRNDEFIIHYSNGDTSNKLGYSDRPNYDISADMKTHNTWGPVQFSVIVKDAITPKYPNGLPEFETSFFAVSKPLYFGSLQKVYLKKMTDL